MRTIGSPLNFKREKSPSGPRFNIYPLPKTNNPFLKNQQEKTKTTIYNHKIKSRSFQIIPSRLAYLKLQ